MNDEEINKSKKILEKNPILKECLNQPAAGQEQHGIYSNLLTPEESAGLPPQIKELSGVWQTVYVLCQAGLSVDDISGVIPNLDKAELLQKCKSYKNVGLVAVTEGALSAIIKRLWMQLEIKSLALITQEKLKKATPWQLSKISELATMINRRKNLVPSQANILQIRIENQLKRVSKEPSTVTHITGQRRIFDKTMDKERIKRTYPHKRHPKAVLDINLTD